MAGISGRRDVSYLPFLNSKAFRLRHLFPFLARLPRALAYGIATRIGRYDAGNRHGYMYNDLQAIEARILEVLPDQGSHQESGQVGICACASMMARDMLDCFYMPKLLVEPPGPFINVSGLEYLSDAYSAGRGVIMIISHFGRFYMLGPALGLNGFPFSMLTTRVDASNPCFDEIDLEYVRAKLANTQIFSGQDWITTGHPPRKIHRLLGEGKIMLVALDGFDTNSSTRLEFSFLQGTLSLPASIARIASATGARLVYVATSDNLENPGVSVRIHPLPDDPNRAMALAVSILERDIKERPWQWWMWPAMPAIWKKNRPADAATPAAE